VARFTPREVTIATFDFEKLVESGTSRLRNDFWCPEPKRSLCSVNVTEAREARDKGCLATPRAGSAERK
jgi:hypothetical protein